MSERRLIVGGESVFSPGILFHKHQGYFSNYGLSLTDYHRYYTFGAYYSFKAILQNLSFKKNDFVLLPAYLCPSMIWPFKELGIKYDFFKLKEGLLPDLSDIDAKARQGLKLILFVDYFGYSYKSYLKEALTNLKSKGVFVLQDAVQVWLNNEDQVYGDFCVNSVRKYSPFEASVILSKQKLHFKTKTLPIMRFIAHKRIGQLMRYYHINYDKFEPDSFLRQINLSNKCYHKKGIAGLPFFNRLLLDKLDFESLGRDRSKVFSALTKLLNKKSLVGLNLGNAVPLTLPLYLEHRDQKKRMLHQENIHCPIHWLLADEINKKEHEYSWDLQYHELSIPININKRYINQYAGILKEII